MFIGPNRSSITVNGLFISPPEQAPEWCDRPEIPRQTVGFGFRQYPLPEKGRFVMRRKWFLRGIDHRDVAAGRGGMRAMAF
jgi:hypothetical protein